MESIISGALKVTLPDPNTQEPGTIFNVGDESYLVCQTGKHKREYTRLEDNEE